MIMRSSDGAGPLTPHVAGFRAELARLGYSTSAANRHLVLMSHLGRWLDREDLDVAAVATEAMEGFFDLRRAAGYVNLPTVRSLAPLTGYLCRIGVLGEPQAPAPAGPVETLLADYRDYLLGQRGLVEGSVRFYVRLARVFVAERNAPAGLSLAERSRRGLLVWGMGVADQCCCGRGNRLAPIRIGWDSAGVCGCAAPARSRSPRGAWGCSSGHEVGRALAGLASPAQPADRGQRGHVNSNICITVSRFA